jgi:hypothetical protein
MRSLKRHQAGSCALLPRAAGAAPCSLLLLLLSRPRSTHLAQYSSSCFM